MDQEPAAGTTAPPPGPARHAEAHVPWPVWAVLYEARWRLRGAALVRTLLALMMGTGMTATGLLLAYPYARDTRLGLPLLVVMAWITVCAGAGLAIWWFLLDRFSSRDIARRIEDRHPELSGAFSNTIEFQHWLSGKQKPPEGISLELAAEEFARASHEAGRLRMGRLNNWRQVGWLALASMAPFLIAGSLILADSFRARRAWIAFREPRQAVQEIRAALETTGAQFDPAKIAAVRVELHYPDYLALPPTIIEASDGSIEAIRGTRVILDIRTLENVRAARMGFADGGSAFTSGPASPRPAVEVTSSRSLKAEFITGTSGVLYFYYRRPWRIGESRSQAFRITVTDDLTPRVEMPEPAGERKVKPGDEFTVRYHAFDDHALTKLQLRLKGRLVDETRELPAPEPGSSSAGGEYKLELGSVDLTGEEEVELFIEALDNDTVSGPKTGVSPKARLLLRADERELLAILDNQERILAGMIDWLGGNLQSYPRSDSPQAEAVLADFMMLVRRGQDVVTALDETVTAMRNNPLADENATEALDNIYKDLSEGARRFEQAGTRIGLPKQLPGTPAAAASSLTSVAGEQVPPLEKHILFLDTLISKQRLDEALRPREEIDAIKNRIRELIDEYRKTGDKALLEQIRKLSNRLKELVSRTMMDAARRFDDLPDEYVNKTERKKEMEELEKLSDQLAGEQFDDLSALENYLNQLDDTFDNMDLARSAFASEAFFKELGRLTELERKVAALEKEQKEIVQEIEKLRGNESDNPFTKAEQEQIRQNIEAASRHLENAGRLQGNRERQLFRELMEARQQGDQERLQQIQQELQNEQMQRLNQRLSNASRQAESAKNDFEALNLGGAMASLKGLEREAANLAQRTSEKGSAPGEPGPRGDAQKASEHIRNAAQLLERKLAEAAQQKPGRQARQGQSDRLGERQGRAQKQAQELAEQLKELAGGSPMIPGESGPEMDSAAGEMGTSSGQLGQGRPQAALSPSASASSRLQSIRQGLSQARQRMENGMQSGGRSGMASGGMPGGGRSRGREGGDGIWQSDPNVEIPGAGEARAPSKDEIINSMKEPAPKAYTPQNRDYYKNLMQN